MHAKLGDTIEFDYSAPDIHDKHPRIFFLAKVGNLVHGLNQHYQTPQEKIFYFYTLKKLFYGPVSTGKITPQGFYQTYIRNRLRTDSYRTYRYGFMSGVSKLSSVLWTFSNKVDIPKQKAPIFSKGDQVRYVSMVRGKLGWKQGVIIGRKVPGANYVVQLKDGSTTERHPSDLRKV